MSLPNLEGIVLQLTYLVIMFAILEFIDEMDVHSIPYIIHSGRFPKCRSPKTNIVSCMSETIFRLDSQYRLNELEIRGEARAV